MCSFDDHLFSLLTLNGDDNIEVVLHKFRQSALLLNVSFSLALENCNIQELFTQNN